ncbi:hypothetical protein G7062_02145 [Erysipelothrix sp. HDW6C]|uniref:permease prefix domain 1-containing protein n=1 Tax=Erysipelothrix sp. HDW6C TaxID=2714930 RepID=UPI001407E6F7|nr:permease prefix domain 1-containing protein [Erysipelothrix sp. HDW6C]QIK69157.1 hypothetical protein G7062_02145 [Erysipelothrix sp. HDW6C]
MENFNRFLNTVLSKIVFFPDRKSIAKELRDHYEDMVEDRIIKGMDIATAESDALSQLGDPYELGLLLHKEHHPLWGWGYLISKWTCLFALILVAIGLVQPTIHALSAVLHPEPKPQMIDSIQDSDIQKHLTLYEEATFGNTSFTLTDVVWLKDKSLRIYGFETQHSPLNSWFLSLNSLSSHAHLDGRKDISSGLFQNYLPSSSYTDTFTFKNQFFINFEDISKFPSTLELDILRGDLSAHKYKFYLEESK